MGDLFSKSIFGRDSSCLYNQNLYWHLRNIHVQAFYSYNNNVHIPSIKNTHCSSVPPLYANWLSVVHKQPHISFTIKLCIILERTSAKAIAGLFDLLAIPPSFGCQLDEPYGFPDDHQQNAAMFQCHVNTGIYKMFFYSCIIVVFCRK